MSNGNKGIGRARGAFADGGCPWDVKIDLEVFWAHVKRLARSDNTPVLMFCNTRFGYDLIHSNPTWFRYDIVLQKPKGVNFLDANRMPMRSHEMLYVFSKKQAFYSRPMGVKCPLSVLEFPSVRGQHPTEKPIALYETLLRLYCPPGGTVLDPTAGSFNSVLAAKGLGLRSVGIEKDRNFFWSAMKKF